MSINSSKWSFGAAKAEHLAALTTIETEHYASEGYPEPLFYQALHQWPELLQVAYCNDQPAAYIMGAPATEHDTVWLMSVLVSNDYRGQGVGKKLMKHWLGCVEKLTFSTIKLTVDPTNTQAIQLYQALDFVELDLQKDYLGPGQHRLLMQRQALT
ncbi:Ribosomal-protein-alanine acetyltransferase [Pseudidiomarina piscicola]|uniref:Ribosomal-protein-alanine acetyltransferase n=1 Tax=Pseudidiomarina piscicola TaxID=2614830 RepID=A0A6S6WIK1_9GAMM|nr:N-acetyltransferase [Pseudidiomarina piscicola]CAB0150178.1 Ribosomal-protein-alanine acetyltransferase [Pseudidiomarina piscicola]VZT39616.1 Ribosomal-protein-alanine acetyltransferase [Pseudomonas aeruginosa]